MTARRIEIHKLQKLVRLHREGERVRVVARLLGMGPNTERRYRAVLSQAGLLEGSADEMPSIEELKAAVKRYMPPKKAPQQQSTVEPWRVYIEARVGEGLKPGAIYHGLRAREPEFNGSRAAIKRMVATLLRERGLRPQDVAATAAAEPGRVAQVDFGYAGRLWDPEVRRQRRAWVFAMLLGYSSHLFAQVVFDESGETWLRLHEEAFRAFGGVPATILPDNLNTAVVREAFGVGEDSGLSRSYRELANHYGFTVDPTPPRALQWKGRIEAGLRYVRRSGLVGREGQDPGGVRAALGRWIAESAGARQHGDAARRPQEVFEAEEKERLRPLPPGACTSCCHDSMDVQSNPQGHGAAAGGLEHTERGVMDEIRVPS
ncbi:uncharacterized protein SOCEGT47_074440 [Sorangium cellulosum]|uniref:Integrase catalytic domain-containing protein n=1 Tax=Sorangium cellulosum TaxID=56 RepID=A0A4P2QB07_SORCE|nr:IS21 family transposase [Sorangium cellulosum]AUX26874.1 uncharacterized protein SOCEGT47_074440 [Sorangium cellulosum]